MSNDKYQFVKQYRPVMLMGHGNKLAKHLDLIPNSTYAIKIGENAFAVTVNNDVHNIVMPEEDQKEYIKQVKAVDTKKGT